MKYLAVLFIFVCGCGNSDSGRDETVKQVLFIGNSLTQTYNVPDIFLEISEHSNNELNIIHVLRGGYELKDLYPIASDIVVKDKPAYIILQEQSETADAQSLTEWIALAEEHNSKIIIYQTWTDNCIELTNLAKAVNLSIAPVGHSFNNYINKSCRCPEAPENGIMPPLTPDGDYHQTQLGSYLAAAVIYMHMFQSLPVASPNLVISQSQWQDIVDSTCPNP